MKTTIKIAKLELSTLFYSPIAWFLLIVFLFQAGFEYTSTLNTFVTYQELGSHKEYLVFLTQKLFGPIVGMFPNILTKLYLYLPLLTMGLMSREISSGTIKLLYSSPITIKEIVFGKFLAMMVYNFMLTLILALFVVLAMFHIQHPDLGMLLTGLLGIYLLLCAYAAIGLFMSSLTSYQVVAALSTFVIFAILAYVGSIWQDIDFVRDLTYTLSIAGRTDQLINGLIATKDLCYFAVIVYVFLGLTILKMLAGRETKSTWVIAGRYGLLIASALLIGYVSSRPILIGYYDATRGKRQTLTPNAQQIIKEMGNEPLEVTSYVNLLDQRYWLGQPGQRNADVARWEPYLRFKSNIKFNYVYYYDSVPDQNVFKANPGKNLRQIAELYAKTYKVDLADFKNPDEMRKTINLLPEQNRYVMQLKYKGKSTFLRLFNDLIVFPSETETTAAFKRMMVKLPKVAFLNGELERSAERFGDDDYKKIANDITFRFSLINQGFDILSLNLRDQRIPDDIKVLVIADPRMNFDQLVLDKIQNFINAGGNLLIAGEPGKQSILNPLIKQFGVQLEEGTIVQQSKEFAPNLTVPHLTRTAFGLKKALLKFYEDSTGVAMKGAAALTYIPNGEYHISPLLVTDKNVSWNKKGKLNLSDQVRQPAMQMAQPVKGMAAGSASARPKQIENTDNAAIVFNAAEGDERKAFPTALSLSRKVSGKEQRIIITGDADFLSNAELSRANLTTANFNFGIEAFGWLADDQFPIDTTRPKAEDVLLTITGSGIGPLKIMCLVVLPSLLLVVGALLLIRRKRK